jgi:hypothetical protein
MNGLKCLQQRRFSECCAIPALVCDRITWVEVETQMDMMLAKFPDTLKDDKLSRLLRAPADRSIFDSQGTLQVLEKFQFGSEKSFHQSVRSNDQQTSHVSFQPHEKSEPGSTFFTRTVVTFHSCHQWLSSGRSRPSVFMLFPRWLFIT